MSAINRFLESSASTLSNILKDPVLKTNVNTVELERKVKIALDEFKNLKKDYNKTPSDLKKIAIFLLQVIDKEVDDLSSELSKEKTSVHAKIEAIHSKLINAQKQISEAPETSTLSQKPESLKVDMRLGFVCDLDAPDENGALQSSLLNLLKNKVPFITTTSMLCNSANPDRQDLVNSTVQFELSEKGANWSIYRQFTGTGEGFLIFIPKSSSDDALEQQKLLAELDFKTDGSLRKISLLEALAPPDKKVSFESFKNLFTETPQANKLFFIAGHGGSRAPGGLNNEHYKELVHLLTEQKCLAMTVTSCYSGGETTLIHIEEGQKGYEKQQKENLAPISEEKSTLRAPLVIMRSIGDYPTKSDMVQEADFTKYFDELTAYLESDRGQTLEDMRDMLNDVEKAAHGRGSKFDANLAQVYYPSGADSPDGFRPIGEKRESYRLTYVNMQKQKLSSYSKGNETPEIQIKNKKFIEVHPIQVDVHLNCQKKNPILLSLVPGNAHHHINSLQLAKSNLHTFFYQQAEFHKEAKIGITKSFHVDTLSNPKGEKWHDVVFKFSEDKMTCYYRKRDQYFYENFNEKTSNPLSKLQYALATETLITSSKPTEQAIRSQSGGQQGINDFEVATKDNEEIFALRQRFNLQKIALLENKIKEDHAQNSATNSENKTTLEALSDELLEGIDKKEDFICLIDYFLSHGRVDLAKIIFEKQTLPADATTIYRKPLVIVAAAAAFNTPSVLPWVYDLLKQGADPNSRNPETGNSLLHIATKLGDQTLIQMLVDKGVDLEARNDYGDPPIFAALYQDNLEVFNLLQKAGADISAVRLEKGYSLLTQALRGISYKLTPYETFERFLEARIDPNRGLFPPLLQAILNNDMHAIDRLLAHGAKLDSIISKTPPILLAIDRLSTKNVNLLLARDDYDPNIADSNGITPLILTLAKNNKIGTEILLKKGGQLPELTWFGRQELLKGCQRMAAEKDFTAIELLLKEGVTPSEEGFLFKKICLELGERECLEQWLSKNLIQSPEILIQIIINKFKKNPSDDKLLGILLKHVDVNFIFEDGTTIFQKIIERNNVELIKQAIQTGNLNEYPPGGKSAFGQIISTGNIELVKLSLSKGSETTAPENSYSPLFCAAEAFVKGKDPEGKIYKMLVDTYQTDQNALKVSGSYASSFVLLLGSGNLELVQWALDHGAKPTLDGITGKITALQKAANIQNDPENLIFHLLLENGADINQKGVNNWTPLGVAIRAGKEDLALICLDNGVILDWDSELEVMEQAIQTGNIQMINLLMGKGIPIDSEDIDAKGLLIKGYLKGGTEVFDALFPYSLQPIIKKSDTFAFWSKLLRANDLEIFKMLLNKITLSDADIEQLFRSSIEHNNDSFCKILDEKGYTFDPSGILKVSESNLTGSSLDYFLSKIISPQERQNFVQHLFREVIFDEDLERIVELINQGADVNGEVFEETPLSIAIRKENLPLVQLLVKNHADLQAKDTYNSNALSAAKKAGNSAIIKFLKEQLA